MARVEGCELVVQRRQAEERHAFATAEAAQGRCAFVKEAWSWLGTPFRDCSDIKGPNGAVDCAMLLVRSAVDTGRLSPFDPRKPEFGGPYSPQWMLHKREERFVDWMVKLGACEVDHPRVGDIVLFQFGHTFSHGAVLVNSEEIVHAWAAAGMVINSMLDEPLLSFLALPQGKYPRPRRYFDIWGG